VLHLSQIDVIDGTPVLDIKPYVPGYDDLRSEDVYSPSWIQEPIESVPKLNVSWTDQVVLLCVSC